MSTSTTLSKNRKTPGVYITEFPSFPPSIVGVATAVPIFIGYTETAADPSSGKQMYLQAVALSSMADYTSYFGYGFNAKGVVEVAEPANYDFQATSMVLATGATTLTSTKNDYVVGTSATVTVNDAGVNEVTIIPQFNLYSAMELFFANGGGNCYVVSVANYWGKQSVTPTPDDDPTTIKADDLTLGLDVSNVTKGVTMLVVPDACLLPPVKDATTGNVTYPEYQKVVVAMLKQSGTLQDRVAILDLPGALDSNNWSETEMAAEADAFYTAIAPASDYFSYGAAYAPALESSLLSSSDVLYGNLSGTTDSTTLVNNLLTSQAYSLYPPANDTYSSKFQSVAARIAAAFPPSGTQTPFGTPTGITATVPSPVADAPAMLVSLPNTALYTAPASDDAAGIQALDQYLCNAVPLLTQIQQILANQLNVVPPSGIMAGVWTQNDANRGVWNAPANVSLNEVIEPKVILTDEQQGDYNVPLNGNAIDILRAMVNRGTVVWGARTLDGNSLDYRYIQVRRTLIYIEQSIKNALQQFVFAANDGGTWATVTATISNFLTQFWQAGGLMGDKASDAFTVNCGVPTTMSGLDVLNGYMIVNVTVQLIHPAEFIELTFKQTMQGV